MHSLDELVLERLLVWLQQGQKVWFCTIVATYGSSPRPKGSLFACNELGEIAGSLSGGCIEEDLIARLTSGAAENQHTQLLQYGVSAAENERLGLPCGGKLEVLLEPLDAAAMPHISHLRDAMHERRYVRRRISLATGVFELTEADSFSPLLLDSEYVAHTFGPRYRMLLVGAGQLSQTLCELAVAMDYQVLVCDPRPKMLQQWNGPEVQLVAGMPDDAVREYANDKDSIVLTLTHDPRIDDMALMEALLHPHFYVGALGSVRTSAARRKRLLQLDISETQMSNLHAPIGLPIGSKTPMGIAVAILAQLTQLRTEASRAHS